MDNTPQTDQILPIEFPYTDPDGRQYRTYKNKKNRTVKVYQPRPDNYVPPLTNRDRKQEILTAVFGEPKKGDYIPGNKGTCSVYNGERFVHHGQGAVSYTHLTLPTKA